MLMVERCHGASRIELTGESREKRMRILLVEDDRRIARFVAKGLREQAYAVDVVGDGDAAIYKLSINDYDAVILDVMIPGRDGFEVCRELRSAGMAVPVIMLTARDTVQDRITGLDSGADDYLIKPFAVTELLARLRALLRRGRSVRPAKISVADLVLDTGAQRATRRDGCSPSRPKNMHCWSIWRERPDESLVARRSPSTFGMKTSIP